MSESNRKPLRYPHEWRERRAAGKRISVITCYDAGMARLAAASSVDALLVGDSLGNTIQGHSNTLPVTMEDMLYHCRLVRRGASEAFIIGDMPFGSYQCGLENALQNAVALLQKGGATAVKLEGADDATLEAISRISAAGVPVMGHLGLTPQSVLTIGGYRVQGRDASDRQRLIVDARRLQEAGCFAIVLELVVRSTAEAITAALEIPTIGIGAGAGCSGQVLVWHDALGLDPDFRPKHSRRYAELGATIQDALNRYAEDVASGRFPAAEESFD